MSSLEGGSMWAIREVLFFWKCCYRGLGFEESKLWGINLTKNTTTFTPEEVEMVVLLLLSANCDMRKCFCQSIALNTPHLLQHFKQAVLVL